MNAPSNIKGFTLTELMITTAVIAVLGAIAIPAYNGYVSTGNFAECQNELAAIQLAEEQFFFENNNYFIGATVTDIEDNSSGYYQSGYNTAAKLAAANCDYAAVFGTSGDNTTYSITATGKNKLTAADTLTIGN